jgi:hypothetical protein
MSDPLEFIPDNPAIHDFMRLLIKAHRLHHFSEWFCIGSADFVKLPSSDEIKKLSFKEFACDNAVFIATYVNSVRIAFCDRHKHILLDYFREKPENVQYDPPAIEKFPYFE